MVQRVAVIGMGQFGSALARSLSQSGAEVLGIDIDERVVEAHRTKVDHAIVLDATDEASFRAAGLEEVDTAVVAISRDLGISILVVAQLVQLAVRHIIGRASTDLHAQILRLVGAHEVVNPEEEMGVALARRLLAPQLHQRVVLPTGHEWVEIDAPPTFWGKRVADLALRERQGLHLVSIKRARSYVDPHGASASKTETVAEPTPEETIAEGDILGIVATDARIRAMPR